MGSEQPMARAHWWRWRNPCRSCAFAGMQLRTADLGLPTALTTMPPAQLQQILRSHRIRGRKSKAKGLGFCCLLLRIPKAIISLRRWENIYLSLLFHQTSHHLTSIRDTSRELRFYVRCRTNELWVPMAEIKWFSVVPFATTVGEKFKFPWNFTALFKPTVNWISKHYWGPTTTRHGTGFRGKSSAFFVNISKQTLDLLNIYYVLGARLGSKKS